MEKRISEVIEAAAEYIEEHGWTQHFFQDPDTGGVCMLGAIRMVTVGTTYARDISKDQHEYLDEIEQQICDILGISYLPTFNDQASMTGRRACDALIEAAKKFRNEGR